MHELSLSSAILDTVLRHAEERKVNAVDLTVGALRQVVPSSLEFYWGIVTRETVCEGSVLNLTEIDATVKCKECEAEPWTLEQPIFRCPACGGSDVEVLTGTEFFVDSIDVEEESYAPH